MYKMEPHAPVKLRRLPWPFCRFCGLLFLKNEPTAESIKLGCNWKEHPSQIPPPRPR